MKRIKPSTIEEAKQLRDMLPEIKEKLEKCPDEDIDYNLYQYKLDYSDLPSKGKAYPENGKISYSSLSYGEVKYLSNSDLTEYEFYKFFFDKKIKTTFDKKLLTFFDFIFIVFIIRLSVFGDNEITMKYTCEKCGKENKNTIKLSELEFFDINVDLPIKFELNDEILEFYPLTIGDYLFLEKSSFKDDEDAKMALMMKNKTFNEAYKIIKEKMSGQLVNALETIDTILYHGVKNLKFTCKECGFLAEFPFYDIYGHVVLQDTIKRFIRDRIHITI